MAKMTDLIVEVNIQQLTVIRVKALELTIEHNLGGHVDGSRPTAEWLIQYAAKLEKYILEGKS